MYIDGYRYRAIHLTGTLAATGGVAGGKGVGGGGLTRYRDI